MILAEQEFQLSGNVSDESMQSIGHMLGAEYIITGSFTPAGTSCRFVINALSVESAQVQSVFIADVAEDPQIVFWLTGKKPIDPKAAKLWSAGVSVGTAFSEPWIILTARGTIAPIRYAFVELGFDVGLISGINKVRYYSLYPYGHLSFFLPLSNDFGWYAGAGGGYMMSSYRLDDIHETPASLMLDVNTGFNIWNYFDVSYTLRTNFNKMINKFSIGFVYRFK